MDSNRTATPVTPHRRQHRATAGTAAAPIASRRRGRPRSKDAENAILRATLALLAETGLSGLTIEGVATRAKVGKTTIYRRWSSRLPLAMDAFMTLPELRLPSTGTLRGDLRHILGQLAELLRSSPLGAVLLHLAAERGTDPAFDAVLGRYLALRRAPIDQVIRRAIERGEIPPHLSPEAGTDLLVGPIINRLLLSLHPFDASFIDLVISTVLMGVGVASPHQPKTRRRRPQQVR